MNITVTAERPANDKVVATITVPPAEVDSYVAQAYRNIARRYQFQGFRRGRAPRPVIDGIVGREAILADATNDLLNDAQPVMLDELDIVAVERPDYGEDPTLVVEHESYVVTATVTVPPTVELDSYDAVAINMPPAEATDAEVDLQIEQLLAYQTTYEDVEDEEREVAEGDIINVDIASREGADDLAGTNRTMSLSADSLPEELVAGITGMRKAETKQVSWSRSHMHGDHEHVHAYDVEVTLNTIKQAVTPELDDELATRSFGFDTVAELRAAVKEEIEEDKQRSLPKLKEDRVVEELGKRVTIEELPEAYENQVFQELANEFLTSLQRQGMSLDMYLGSRQIDTEASSPTCTSRPASARQGLALDALAKEKGFEASEEDVRSEFEKAGVEDVDASIDEFRKDGRLSAIRESIRRTKAVRWLVDNAEVTEVDEVAERRASRETETAE